VSVDLAVVERLELVLLLLHPVEVFFDGFALDFELAAFHLDVAAFTVRLDFGGENVAHVGLLFLERLLVDVTGVAFLLQQEIHGLEFAFKLLLRFRHHELEGFLVLQLNGQLVLELGVHFAQAVQVFHFLLPLNVYFFGFLFDVVNPLLEAGI